MQHEQNKRKEVENLSMVLMMQKRKQLNSQLHFEIEAEASIAVSRTTYTKLETERLQPRRIK